MRTDFDKSLKLTATYYFGAEPQDQGCHIGSANNKRMVIDSAMFLTLFLVHVWSNQMAYKTPQVDCLFLSKRAFKEHYVV